VATHTGSLPEVLGDGADLVDVGDADALAQALHRVLTDDAHAADLVRRGEANVGRHSWPEAADQFAALLAEVRSA
jgi:glycosyltransferase involved in cell wall biosynthesis